MNAVIELKNVKKSFKNKCIYENINLKINEGECVGFVGHNGSGKSVLFNIISGLLPIEEGKVIINGKCLGKDLDYPESVGVLINEPGYIEYLNGFKNLKMLADIRNEVTDEDIVNTMHLVGLDPNDKTRVKNYSMGMKQKLGIAQAIMENQKIIILDEPYNALDYNTNIEITKLLFTLKEQGRTILLTSHQHEYLEKLCDKMYFIENHGLTVFDDVIKKKYFEIL